MMLNLVKLDTIIYKKLKLKMIVTDRFEFFKSDLEYGTDLFNEFISIFLRLKLILSVTKLLMKHYYLSSASSVAS